MIEHVEEFRAHLQVEAFGELDVLGEPRIQVPEAWSLRQIAAASHLARRRDAEERLGADHIAAIVMWIGRIGNQGTDVIRSWPCRSRHCLKMAGIIGPYNQNRTGVSIVGGESTYFKVCTPTSPKSY